MSIQIKEIIASDTISGLVEKLNYNFDQILLNGGGPRGPQGVSGAKGNIGDRGIRGNIWIVKDVEEPALNNDDYIPGDKLVLGTGEIKTVVEVNGVKTWESTNVNIKGATGDQGDNDVVSYITNGSNTKQIVHFKTYEYNNANTLSTVLIGGASSGTGVGLAEQYIVPNDLLSNTSIKNTSLLIHSNNVHSKAIVFTGRKVGAINHTDKLNEAAYIRLDDNDSIRINSGATEGSSITLGKNDESKIMIRKDDLSISHNSIISIKRANWDIIKIDSSADNIPPHASTPGSRLLLHANKIGVLAKDLQLNSVDNYIRIGGGSTRERILVEANKGNINIYAFDKTDSKGEIVMLGNGNVTLGGIDIAANNTLTHISAIQFIKDSVSNRKNKITLKSNEIILSTSRYKNINDDNAGLDAYIHMKNGDYAPENKGIDLVISSGNLNLINATSIGSIALRNGGVDANNIIELNRTAGNNRILIAGVIANKPGLRLDNVNNNVQLISKTIWNDGASFIDVDDLPNLNSVHIRKNTTSISPNLILSSPNIIYSSSRLLYGYQGNTSNGHRSTEQSITVNPGSVKLTYGRGDHYADTTGHNQGFVIRAFSYPASNPGFKIIDGSGGNNIPLNIDRNGISSAGYLTILGHSNLAGNCNVGGAADTTAKLTAVNTAMPGILYSCRLKYDHAIRKVTQSHTWGPIAAQTGDVDSSVSYDYPLNFNFNPNPKKRNIYHGNQFTGPKGVNYAIQFGVASTVNDSTKFNGIVLSLYRKNDAGSWEQIDLSEDFTVQVTPIKNRAENVFHADYVYDYIDDNWDGVGQGTGMSLIFYTYRFVNATHIEVSDGIPISITLIGPIVKIDHSTGKVLWDFR